jgi:3-dehydroquinate synthetase
MGLVLASRLSDRVFRGDMDTPTALEGSVAIDLCDCGLYPESPYTIDEMAEHMLKDKKAEAGKVHFVLLREVGDVTTYALSVDEVVKLLK